MSKQFDIIGDIHGHADELKRLLTSLGYQRSGKGYRHADRKVAFVGDFVDRQLEKSSGLLVRWLMRGMR